MDINACRLPDSFAFKSGEFGTYLVGIEQLSALGGGVAFANLGLNLGTIRG
jgi:hypothetical protein